MKSTLILQPGTVHVLLSHQLVEGIGLEIAEIMGQLTEKTVIIDMSQVKRINSLGCREWCLAMEPLFSSFLVEFIRCPVAFIDYCNMVPNLLGASGSGASALVQSFEAPYLCSNCNLPVPMLLNLNDVLKTRQLPILACPKCNEASKCEMESEDYLLFLDRTL